MNQIRSRQIARLEKRALPYIKHVQLGLVTEDLNRRWYQANTGQVILDVQRNIRHPVLHWMGATLDGRVEGSDAVFEAKFMLPWSFSSGRQKIHAAAATQYVGHRSADSGTVCDYGRRQMGGDPGPCRSALSAFNRHRRTQVLALRRER
jgi:hypothetical protein